MEDYASMRRMGPTARFGWLLRFACIMALAFVAHAHRPVSLSAASSVDLAAYVLPDGTLPIICHAGSAGEQDTHPDRLCDFCHIASGSALPSPPDGAPAIVFAGKGTPLGAEQACAVRRRCFPPSAPPHGPPLSHMNVLT